MVSNIALADQLPLWEIGLGGGILRIPDYRGSDEARAYPFPFLIPFYRGTVWRSDEEGIRGELVKTRQIRLDFSLDGNVPVDAKKNKARRDMDTLDPTLQIGPALNIKLWHDYLLQQSLIAFLPVRGVFAVDLSTGKMHSTGYTFSPQFTYYRKVDFLNGKWRFGLSAGLEYGTETFHDYYYQVDQQDASSDRPAYDARGGFGGYRSNLTFHRRFNNKWISLFARYDNLTGAVMENSPLVRTNSGLTFGFLVTWFVQQSAQVTRAEDWIYK